MALGGPPSSGEHLLIGAAHEMDNDRAGGSFQRVNYLVEHPAGVGLPEVIRILDHDDGDNLPIYISSDEEEEGEVVEDEFEDVPPLFYDNADEFDWTGEDSGYESLFEDEEELEDDNVRPRSPLIQQLPPDNFWQHWRQDYPPVPVAGPRVPDAAPVAAPVAVPQQLTVRHPLVPVQHHELPGASASQQPEEPSPSTSGLSSSTKRSREDSHGEEVTAKRLRWNCEESPDNSAPSTSGHSSSTSSSGDERYRDSTPSTFGLSSSTKRSREDSHGEEVTAKRLRWNCEESPDNSAPSTSGHSSSTSSSGDERYRDSTPSTFGLSSSTKRSREDSHGEEVTAKRLRWNCEESPDNSAPSTSGHSSSTSSSRDESYRDSTPSTSGLSSSTSSSRDESYGDLTPSTSGLSSSATNRRFWDLFGIPLWADDSDSD